MSCRTLVLLVICCWNFHPHGSAFSQEYLWSNFAGGAGGQGDTDGSGTSARFRSLGRFASDASGNVYVADAGNHTIRKITPAGVVSTIAGKAGEAGMTDGAVDVARFNLPTGLEVDSTGVIYVADAGNHTIRKIATNGQVSTVAGTAGSSGNTNGLAAAARFNFPRDVAVDSSGNLFVADTGNHTIRKITATGVVTTLVGSPGVPGSDSGVGGAARFSSPGSLVLYRSDQLYVVDSGNFAIRSVSTAGSAGQPITSSQLSGPSDLAVSSTGVIYITDLNRQTVVRWVVGQEMTTLAGTIFTRACY